MDKIDKIFDTLKEEISKITKENAQLKEEVRSLQIILKEKNEDYKRLAAILKDQTEHWKKVTAKLMANRKTNTSSGNRKQIDEIESIEIEKQNVKSSISDDESTQLPQNKTIENQKFTDIQTQTQSPPKHQQEETQSHLDTLISLISGSSDTDLDHDESKENTSVQSAVSVPFDYQPRKRKSHSRGCPCCDKFYQATRSSSTGPKVADSFLVSPKTPPGFWDTSFTPRQ